MGDVTQSQHDSLSGSKRQSHAAVGHTDEASPKRVCKEAVSEIKTTFRAVADCSKFKHLIEVIDNVLKEVEFEAIHEPDNFTGLQIRTFDSKGVCMVTAHMECQVTCSQRHRFRLDSKTLLTCLRAIPAECSFLDIFQSAGEENEVRITTSQGPERICFTLNSIWLDDKPGELKNLKYDYCISMEVTSIRNLVRLCKDLKSESITFELWRRRAENAEPIMISSNVGGSNRGVSSFLCVKCSGDTASMERHFVSPDMITGSDDSEHMVEDEVSAEIDTADYERKCCEQFSTEYLNMFVKSMDKTNLTLRLAPQKPILVSYPLDSETSNIMFLLAPREEE